MLKTLSVLSLIATLTTAQTGVFTLMDYPLLAVTMIQNRAYRLLDNKELYFPNYTECTAMEPTNVVAGLTQTLYCNPVVGSTEGILNETGYDYSGDLAECADLCYQWNLNNADAECLSFNKIHETSSSSSNFMCQLLSCSHFNTTVGFFNANGWGHNDYGFLNSEVSPKCRGLHMTEAERQLYDHHDNGYGSYMCNVTADDLEVHNTNFYTYRTLVECAAACVHMISCIGFNYNTDTFTCLPHAAFTHVDPQCLIATAEPELETRYFGREFFLPDIFVNQTAYGYGCSSLVNHTLNVFSAAHSDIRYNPADCANHCRDDGLCVGFELNSDKCTTFSQCDNTYVDPSGNRVVLFIDKDEIVTNNYIFVVDGVANETACTELAREADTYVLSFQTRRTDSAFVNTGCYLNVYTTEEGSNTLAQVMPVLSTGIIEANRWVASTATSWGIGRIMTDVIPDGQQVISEFNSTFDGTGVNIYVIDSGIDPSNTLFQNRAFIGGDFINERSTADLNGHGTHCAGTVGADDIGIARGASVYGIKSLSEKGTGSYFTIVKGMEWAYKHANGQRGIISMSLSGGQSNVLDKIISDVTNSLNMAIVAAAGNRASDACSYTPALYGGRNIKNFITVSSMDQNDARSSFSNYGSCANIFAPGTDITSTWLSGGTNTISGTSMATPHVSGVLALFLEKNGFDMSLAIDELFAEATAGVLSDVRGTPNLLLRAPLNGTAVVFGDLPSEGLSTVVVAGIAGGGASVLAGVSYIGYQYWFAPVKTAKYSFVY